MKIISLLIRNSIRMDFKMLIPFFFTVVLIVFVISSASVSNELFVSESSQPAIIKYGGEVTVYKSHKPATFVMGSDGLAITWYAHLFDPALLEGVAAPDDMTYDLSLWGRSKIYNNLDVELVGRKKSVNSPAWDMNSGETVPDMTVEDWYQAGRPATVLLGDKVPNELRALMSIDSEVQVFVPKIIESGGNLNLKGYSNTVMLPKDADQMDYLDYDHGQWIGFKIVGIARDGTTGAAGIGFILPLPVLQGLTNAGDLINHAGISMPETTDADISAKAAAITAQGQGLYGLKTTDMFISSFKSVRNLEQQAEMLVYAAYLIGSLMVICVLVLMLRSRRASDVQLMTLGISRWILAVVVVFEIFIISLGAVMMGALLPTIISLIRSQSLALDGVKTAQLFLIVPFNLIVALVVSQIMLPNSKQCLEVLTNE